MGSLFGGLMALAGQDVILYDVDSAKVDQVNKNGLVIMGQDQRPRQVGIKAMASLAGPMVDDLFIVFVKSYQTAAAARQISPFAAGASILTLQNGLGNVEALSEYFAAEQIFAGVTYQGSRQVSSNTIRHTGSGLTSIAPLSAQNMPRAGQIADFLSACSIPAKATIDLAAMLWQKLIVNSVINPVAAISGLKNGQLLQNEEWLPFMQAIAAEGIAVARAEGAALAYEEIWAAVEQTCRLTADNKASMLADVEAGRKTEIEAINGSIVRLGLKYGIETGANLSIMQKVISLLEGGGNSIISKCCGYNCLC
jgi:2-dehydropantoate 2-reductase